MLETYMLVQLVAVADCGSVSKAAESLYLSQPALSRTMNKIEEILQVKLFDRTKNKLELNENGRLAVECARKILDDGDEMITRVRAFDLSRRTISVYSCAPAPLWIIVPMLSELYPEMKISSEMKYHENMESELLENNCIVLVTPYFVDDPDIVCRKLFEEQLYISVPPAHPLAGYSEVTFEDIDGETMLLFSDLGYWHEVHRTKTPNTKYILQSEYETMSALVKASALPCYVTNITLNMRNEEGRVNIPVSDDEAKATFYVCFKKDEKKRFKAFDNRIQEYSGTDRNI